jgi:hypothetical protein
MGNKEHQAKREQRRVEWAGHLERQAQSGESISAYCSANGLKSWQFHYYQRALRKSQPETQVEPGFDPLLPCGAGSLCLEVGGCRLVIGRPIDTELLRQVVAILKSA